VEFFRPNKLVQKLLATLPSRSRIRKAFATLPDLVEALLLISPIAVQLLRVRCG